MLTIRFRFALILTCCLYLIACHSSKNVTETTTEETEQSRLRHIQGTKLTSTLEILGDINFNDSSQRFVPRQHTPAKLTLQQEQINLADTTNKRESTLSTINSVSEKNVSVNPNNDCLWVTLSLITLIVIAIIVLGYCIRLIKQKILG